MLPFATSLQPGSKPSGQLLSATCVLNEVLVGELHRKLAETTGSEGSSPGLQVDRQAFATWFLSNKMETRDASIEKQRLQSRVQVLGTRLKSMAASMAKFEEFANKANI